MRVIKVICRTHVMSIKKKKNISGRKKKVCPDMRTQLNNVVSAAVACQGSRGIHQSHLQLGPGDVRDKQSHVAPVARFRLILFSCEINTCQPCWEDLGEGREAAEGIPPY